MTRSQPRIWPLRIGPQGRLRLPAELRKALRLRSGEILMAELMEDRLVLRPRRAVEEELWALFERVEGSLAADLIRERRAEAHREASG